MHHCVEAIRMKSETKDPPVRLQGNFLVGHRNILREGRRAEGPNCVAVAGSIVMRVDVSLDFDRDAVLDRIVAAWNAHDELTVLASLAEPLGVEQRDWADLGV